MEECVLFMPSLTVDISLWSYTSHMHAPTCTYAHITWLSHVLPVGCLAFLYTFFLILFV